MMYYKEYLRKSSERFELRNPLKEITFEIKEIEDLSKIPPKLPNKTRLIIKCGNVKTLEGFFSDLSNIEDLEIYSRYLQDLKGFPEELPSLRRLLIESLMENGTWKYLSFDSLSGIPHKLPKLIYISLAHTNFQNFDNLPPILPSLEEIKCEDQQLRNFLGFPEEIPNFK